MGTSENIATIFAVGILGYFAYKVILPKLKEGGIQLPELPNLLPQLPQQQPVVEPTNEDPQMTTPPSQKPKKPILTPTKSEMTSPDVASTAFTFNVVGDIDYHNGTAENLCSSNPTIALIIGDFSYDTNGQKWWSTTMKACNGKNVMGSVGNHDGDGKAFIGLFPANGGKWTAIKKIGSIAFVSLHTGTCSAICSNPSTEEPTVKAAQDDPSVKFIIVHFHKPIFTTGTAPDTPMSFHTMLKKYSKVKMVFSGHNHTYKRYVPQDGIQYITAGQGGHAGNDTPTKGSSSNTIGVVKCRVDTSGGITCQYVSNNGTILDQWGLTSAGKHTGTGGVTPKQGSAPAESAYVHSYFSNLVPEYDYADKEDRDNAIIALMDQHELQTHPRRKFNNTIYHYSRWVR